MHCILSFDLVVRALKIKLLQAHGKESEEKLDVVQLCETLMIRLSH